MQRIAIVTDSTPYLPPEIIQKYSIHVIPLKLHWDGETYRDGIDITLKEFYTRLETSSTLPTTSQPSVSEFLQTYEKLADEHEGIIVPLVSSGVSGTLASALSAAAEFKKIPVEVIDTRTAAAGVGLVVLAVAEAIEQGCSLSETAQIARQVSQKLGTYFAVDTLKYLHKGGRIGGATRYLGTAFSIKPILYLNEEGKIDAFERVRTKTKALQRLVDLAGEKAGSQPAVVGIMHADSPEEAAGFQEALTRRIECESVHIYELSPVISTHVGPGTIGISLYTN